MIGAERKEQIPPKVGPPRYPKGLQWCWMYCHTPEKKKCLDLCKNGDCPDPECMAICPHAFSRSAEGRQVRHRWGCWERRYTNKFGDITIPTCYTTRCRNKCPAQRLPDERRGGR